MPFDFADAWGEEEEERSEQKTVEEKTDSSFSPVSARVTTVGEGDGTSPSLRLLQELEEAKRDRARMLTLLVVGCAVSLYSMHSYVCSVNRKLVRLREEMWFRNM